VWDTPLDALPTWRARLIRLARLLAVLARDFVSGELTLRAMSLVYTTLLSLVPLLALSFSVLKAFGIHNQIEPILHNFLAPLGPKSDEITARIVQFVERMNVGVLGSVGVALLVYTAISLVQKLERSFNYIWHIGETRGIGERFSRYLSVLLIGPLLVFSAVGITAVVVNLDWVQRLLAVEPLGKLYALLSRVVPYMLVIAAFSFIYVFIPNTNVRLRAALIGGIAGGLLWQTGGWAFAHFVATSTRYSAIYSSFAILLLFMIWLYLSWLMLLFGSSLSFYLQHPEYVLQQGGEPRLSNRMRETVALMVMSLVAGRHREGLPACNITEIAHHLHVPEPSLEPVLKALIEHNVLARTADTPIGYLPVRELSTLKVSELLDIVRRADEERYLDETALVAFAPVADAMERVQRGMHDALANLSVADLALRPDPGSVDAQGWSKLPGDRCHRS